MAKKHTVYKRLDEELKRELAGFVVEILRSEEAKIIKSRHDKKRANIKLALRKYREMVEHVERTVYNAVHAEDDLTLQELLELMSGDRAENFRIESLRESAAKAQMLVSHMNRMIRSYKLSCDRSKKEEDKRRFRVLHAMYIEHEPKTADQIAQDEFIDKSTVYRDIDAAADRLAVLFFGVYGLKFL